MVQHRPELVGEQWHMALRRHLGTTSHSKSCSQLLHLEDVVEGTLEHRLAEEAASRIDTNHGLKERCIASQASIVRSSIHLVGAVQPHTTISQVSRKRPKTMRNSRKSGLRGVTHKVSGPRPLHRAKMAMEMDLVFGMQG